MEALQKLGGHSGKVHDLRLSHAFVSTIAACYRGMWVFDNALVCLDPEMDRTDEMRKTERVLEIVEEWTQRLDRGQPVITAADRPVLGEEGSRAWRLLQVAEGRLRALIGDLTSSSDLDQLAQDELARNLRVAAMCEIAHARRTSLEALLAQATALGATADAERWRGRVLSSEQQVARAEWMLERFRRVDEAPSLEMVAELLDATLLLPARVAQRVIDIGRVFGLYTGMFDYEDAGIPEAQIAVWAESGFDPHAAGRWFAAGVTPQQALEWIRAGADDPLVAAGFLWRGFTVREASPWLQRFINGRQAAAWVAAGSAAADAQEWIALGVRTPDAVAAMPSSRRVM